MAEDQRDGLPPTDNPGTTTQQTQHSKPDQKPSETSGEPTIPRNIYDLTTRFTSSGLFFMIVGAIFLYVAFHTMGRTHAAMSFVFVVVGIAILLYGTGTQGIGNFDSGEGAEKVARYKVALAGGAGVIAFCVGAGFVAFAPKMKSAFQIEQKYLRLHLKGKGLVPDDIGLYLPDVRINGNPVPAVRRGDYIEVYAPYVLNAETASFEIRAKLYLADPIPLLNNRASGEYRLVMKVNGDIEEDGSPAGSFFEEAGYDFPRYTLRKVIDLSAPATLTLDGVVPK